MLNIIMYQLKAFKTRTGYLGVCVVPKVRVTRVKQRLVDPKLNNCLMQSISDINSIRTMTMKTSRIII